MIIDNTNEQEVRLSLPANLTSSSTFLIPENLLSLLNNILQNNRCNVRELLSILLRRFSKSSEFPKKFQNDHVKTRYQKPGNSLVRIDFRPRLKDWAELKILARGMGCSCCLLFILLLKFFSKKKRKSKRNNSAQNSHTPCLSLIENLNQFNDNYGRIIIRTLLPPTLYNSD